MKYWFDGILLLCSKVSFCDKQSLRLLAIWCQSLLSVCNILSVDNMPSVDHWKVFFSFYCQLNESCQKPTNFQSYGNSRHDVLPPHPHDLLALRSSPQGPQVYKFFMLNWTANYLHPKCVKFLDPFTFTELLLCQQLFIIEFINPFRPDTNSKFKNFPRLYV